MVVRGPGLRIETERLTNVNKDGFAALDED